jgi:hypothetical protein
VTSGIGNPDWQRRYTFSAVPLFSALFGLSGPVVSSPIDANGYPYIILTSRAAGTTAFIHVTVFWYQDSAGTILVSGTDFVTVPGADETIKMPAAARYFAIHTENVGGGTTGNTLILAYGTTADHHDMMTGITSQLIAAVNASIGAGVTSTVAFPNMLPGRVMVQFNHATNNLWQGWLEYYDRVAAAWTIFWNVHGTDVGMAYNTQVWLPFAPVRINVKNTDTVTQITQASVVTANAP